jgi:hypothetical protein
MKKTLLTLGMCLVTCGLFAQGTVNFNNRVLASGVSAPVYFEDGTTGADSTIVGQLWYDNAGTWTAVGATIPFRDGAGAGFLNATGLDTSRTLDGIAAGSPATMQMRAWSAAYATYGEAVAGAPGTFFGSSPDLTINTGGAGSPPGLPADLVGLQGFNLSVVPVPEPSVIMLGLAGAGLLWFRRKK